MTKKAKILLLPVGILLGVIVIFVLASVIYSKTQPGPTLVANFVDLNKVKRISKFRSCVGHTTVPVDGREMKRSMKHYVEVKPEFHKNGLVEIYSPYDGYVTVIRKELEMGLEGEIWIAPDRGFLSVLPPFGVWHFSVQHIEPRKDLKRGSKVKAGEIIGHAAFIKERGATFDVVYGKMARPKVLDNWTSPFADLDSIFNNMDRAVLDLFEKKGLYRDSLILAKEDRDARPCVYKGKGPYFLGDSPDDWVLVE